MATLPVEPSQPAPPDALYSDEMRARFDAFASELGPTYAEQDPFPHAVIDDFLPPDLLEQVRMRVREATAGSGRV